MEILSFLVLPFLAGLVLTGIHAYLGVHVVERGVIFVDLSLAQIAALGTTVALLAGYDVHSTASYFWSLGFTLVGAAFFAFARVKRETRIAQEAIIGIVYAVSAAVVTGLGIFLSFKICLPTGATIVCTFGIALMLMAIVRLFVRNGTQAA